MNSTLMYWYSRIKTHMDKLQEIDAISAKQAYDVGAACLLNKLLYEARINHTEAIEGFSMMMEVNKIHKTLLLVSNLLQTKSSIEDSDTSSGESDSDDDIEDIDFSHDLVF